MYEDEINSWVPHLSTCFQLLFHTLQRDLLRFLQNLPYLRKQNHHTCLPIHCFSSRKPAKHWQKLWGTNSTWLIQLFVLNRAVRSSRCIVFTWSTNRTLRNFHPNVFFGCSFKKINCILLIWVANCSKKSQRKNQETQTSARGNSLKQNLSALMPRSSFSILQNKPQLFKE